MSHLFRLCSHMVTPGHIYGGQAGSTHPIQMLSCSKLEMPSSSTPPTVLYNPETHLTPEESHKQCWIQQTCFL